ncbi:MAG: hypothetical protein [Caudoviricetes sp.]|nr:MAG: hypothetical protein [Caudoviricetes sp.]
MTYKFKSEHHRQVYSNECRSNNVLAAQLQNDPFDLVIHDGRAIAVIKNDKIIRHIEDSGTAPFTKYELSAYIEEVKLPITTEVYKFINEELRREYEKNFPINATVSKLIGNKSFTGIHDQKGKISKIIVDSVPFSESGAILFNHSEIKKYLVVATETSITDLEKQEIELLDKQILALEAKLESAKQRKKDLYDQGF